MRLVGPKSSDLIVESRHAELGRRIQRTVEQSIGPRVLAPQLHQLLALGVGQALAGAVFDLGLVSACSAFQSIDRASLLDRGCARFLVSRVRGS